MRLLPHPPPNPHRSTLRKAADMLDLIMFLLPALGGLIGGYVIAMGTLNDEANELMEWISILREENMRLQADTRFLKSILEDPNRPRN